MIALLSNQKLGLALAAGLFLSFSLATPLPAKDGDDQMEKNAKTSPGNSSSNGKENANNGGGGNSNNSSSNNQGNDNKSNNGASSNSSDKESQDASKASAANGKSNSDKEEDRGERVGPENITFIRGNNSQIQLGKLKAQILNHIFKSIRHSKQDDKKVTLCHKGHAITVSENAIHAHLAHGDTLGSCDVTPGKNK
jgi:hypothetical protein